MCSTKDGLEKKLRSLGVVSDISGIFNALEFKYHAKKKPELVDVTFHHTGKEFTKSLWICGWNMVEFSPENPLMSCIYKGERYPLVCLEHNTPVFYFDITGSIDYILNERYLSPRRPLLTRTGAHPHKISGNSRILAGKLLRRIQRIVKKVYFPSFPGIPLDNSVDILREFLIQTLAITRPDVTIRNFWPDGCSYACTLSYDVDSEWVFRDNNYLIFLDLEKENNLKSCWNFVTNMYEIDDTVLRNLINNGVEIGCHGVYHDNKIAFLSVEKIQERFRRAAPFLEQYDVKGFKSPAYFRSDNLKQVLKSRFAYDTSIHDTYIDTYFIIPRVEGVCTVFPFCGDGLIYVPTTVPEDVYLDSLQLTGEEILERQVKKINYIRERGGLIHILIHPEPHISAREDLFANLKTLLSMIKNDSQCWYASPGGIARYVRETYLCAESAG